MNFLQILVALLIIGACLTALLRQAPSKIQDRIIAPQMLTPPNTYCENHVMWVYPDSETGDSGQ